MIKIPLYSGTANAHQRISIQLGDNLLDIRINYISYLVYPAWAMDVYQDGTPLILGAMLEPNSEVSQGYQANIGRFFFVGDEVTVDNLGVTNSLIWSER